ncbi:MULTISPECIES: endonuclease V [unclassified Nocardia]|uniref:endonuclease V n=1 Tax=unclassified Nocardia TaxID=2637762 RepID=UPI001CE44F62|nr:MULTISPECIES: endonuclease V [unclassified Nocardia]
MRISIRRPWPTTPEQAVALQDELRPLVDPVNPRPPDFRTVAGLDSAYADSGAVAAAVVVLDCATAESVDSVVVHGRTEFPYVPGLLAFRELPTTVAALEKLSTTPDLLICDGQGLAHPRRFGLACHLGVLTGIPTIGVAKTVWGEYTEPGPERGAATDLVLDGEVVGRALRTRAGVKPVFVSVGHRIDLDTACAQVLALTPKYRIPETTRRADQLCRRALKEAAA